MNRRTVALGAAQPAIRGCATTQPMSPVNRDQAPVVAVRKAPMSRPDKGSRRSQALRDAALWCESEVCSVNTMMDARRIADIVSGSRFVAVVQHVPISTGNRP